jgi:hypothetical protein
VQFVALALDHVSVVEPPELTLIGLAERTTVGAAGALTGTVKDCCALPPIPVQTNP